jgi:hypothetical protein
MNSRFAQMASAFLFGCVALATVLWLAFRSETLNEQQFEILRIVLALAGGGVGAMMPGFLNVNINLSAMNAMRAGGALAVFVVLYFWSPAHWQPAHDGTVIQQTNGANSPAQNGTGNKVIINGKP